MWSMWAWEMKRKSWEMARCGHRPMSKARFSVGKIIHVSWPPIDRPSIGYPSMFSPLLFFEASSFWSAINGHSVERKLWVSFSSLIHKTTCCKGADSGYFLALAGTRWAAASGSRR